MSMLNHLNHRSYHCDVFQSRTRHVYAWEAVDDLCIKAKNWKDLMTDAPFERKDLIMIQDPLDDALNARRDISNFNYLK